MEEWAEEGESFMEYSQVTGLSGMGQEVRWTKLEYCFPGLFQWHKVLYDVTAPAHAEKSQHLTNEMVIHRSCLLIPLFFHINKRIKLQE